MICPFCKNDALEEKQEFCYECSSCGLTLRAETSSSSHQLEKTEDRDQTTQASDVRIDSTEGLHDEAEGQKRKGEKAEDTPTKRRSLGTDEAPIPPEATDATASAVENLALEKELEQKQASPDKTTGQETNDKQHTSGTSTSECSSEGESNSNSNPTGTFYDHQKERAIQNTKFQESLRPEITSVCVSETPLGASDPSSFDTGVKSEPESVPGLGLGPDSELLTVKNNDSEDGHITVDTENSATAEQFQDEDDSGDSDGSSASDLQEEDVKQSKDDTRKPRSGKKQESTSKTQRKKKQDRKKRRVEREKSNIEGDIVDLHESGEESRRKGSAIASKREQNNNDPKSLKEKEKEKEEKKQKEKTPELHNVATCKGDKMTVIFHAVLAPHFNFEEDQGDRLFMRFGGVEFGNFNKNIVELKPERLLDNDFLLVRGEMQVAFRNVSNNVSYKYIVLRKGRTKKDDDVHLWERLVHGGPYKNRCLRIPKERCYVGAIWHQYDDAIFSEPNLFQKLLNKLPVWKSMDVLEGRNLATWTMLPPWDGCLVRKGDSEMAAWETVQMIKDLAYCMTKSTVEEYGLNKPNVPSRYSFSNILKDYLKPKLEHIASLRAATEAHKSGFLQCTHLHLDKSFCLYPG